MLFYPQWIIYNRIKSFNLVQYRLQIYKCYCELPEHVEAFTLPAKLRMLELVSPIKFVQLVLLILFLRVIFPVPQNKIIYIGGSYWHFERNDNSCARLTYALKCQQNRPPNRTTKKIPCMSQHPLESLLPLIENHLHKLVLLALFWLLRHQFLFNS